MSEATSPPRPMRAACLHPHFSLGLFASCRPLHEILLAQLSVQAHGLKPTVPPETLGVCGEPSTIATKDDYGDGPFIMNGSWMTIGTQTQLVLRRSPYPLVVSVLFARPDHFVDLK